jgi:YegS/Rv2252/BmrU family lipid kinase
VRACVIFNPTARGDKARLFRHQLESMGAVCVFRPTQAAGMARTLATEAVAEGFDTVVAAGGDGTVNEVLNGMVDTQEELSRARLGILPLGTANVFARELGIPLDLKQAWEVVSGTRERRVDLVRAVFEQKGGVTSKCVAQLAGAGLDARSVELMNWDTKKRAAQVAYLLAGWRALNEPQPVIRVRVDDEETEARLVLVGNGRLYGGPFTFFPGASLDDGRLDVTVFPRVNAAVAAACLPGLLWGRLLRLAGARFLRGRRVELSSRERVPFQVDGDAAGRLPASITVERQQAVRVAA